MYRILIVEDDRDISRLIKIALVNAGYSADIASDGAIGADMIEKRKYNLVLLDVMMPNVNGYELFPYIKEYRIPVIFITALGTISDKKKGFGMGADDYLVKPFEIEELVLRVENVLRHYGLGSEIVKVFDIIINTATRTVRKNDQEIQLTPKEYELFMLLVRNKNAALNRVIMYEKVWGDEQSDNTRTLDIHIRRIRKKLALEKEIKTVYKVGYMLEVDE